MFRSADVRGGPEIGVPALSVRLHDSLAEVEPTWRQLETTGVLTPYQRFDWIAALVSSGLERVDRMAIIVVMLGDKPAGILPLSISRRFGLREARLIGTARSNGDWLLGDEALLARLTPGTLTALLAEVAGVAGGIDLIRLFNQATDWQGVDNPLLRLSREAAPNNLYFATVGPSPLPFIEHRFTAKRRNNIRRGARRLEEGFGALTLRRADAAGELQRQHTAFLAQRAARFAEMGVDNIFAEPAFVTFFRTLAEQGFGQERPSLAFHALYAGDEIVATSIGTFAGSHYSQYINSTASGPAAKYSLMSVLMAELMDELLATGVTTIDMGAGDFDYKTDWTEPRPLFHSVIPLTIHGRLAVPWMDAGRALKRTIKQNARLWALAQTARRMAYRVRHRG